MRHLPTALAFAALAFAAACNSSSGGPDGSADALFDTPTNACLAYGAGYTCQSGTTCSAGYSNVQDLDCASTGQLCCGLLPEAGYDASYEASIFKDGATFDTGSPDAGHDSGVDAKKPTDGAVDSTTHPDGGIDGGHDAGTDAVHHDAGTDGGHDAGIDAAHHDAESDALHDGAPSDAKSG